MKKLLFLFLLSWNYLFSQAPVLQNFTSLSDENLNGLQPVAYRHVGDSIKRFVSISLTSGTLNNVSISTVIEPELSFQNLFEFSNNNPIPFTLTPTGYQITLAGAQIDQYINSTVGIANNFNGQLDPGEVLEFSERSRVISCSVGDQNNASNQSLYTLSGSISGTCQANVLVYSGAGMDSQILTNTFNGFCQDSVMVWDGIFMIN